MQEISLRYFRGTFGFWIWDFLWAMLNTRELNQVLSLQILSNKLDYTPHTNLPLLLSEFHMVGCILWDNHWNHLLNKCMCKGQRALKYIKWVSQYRLSIYTWKILLLSHSCLKMWPSPTTGLSSLRENTFWIQYNS